MLKLIRVRIFGDVQNTFDFAHAIYGACKELVDLDVVSNVQMEGAIDVDCLLRGGIFKRFVSFVKLNKQITALRNRNINIDILWSI